MSQSSTQSRLSLLEVSSHHGGSARSINTERTSIKDVQNHGGINRSLGSSISKRNARVKRTIVRQRKQSAAGGYSFTDVVVKTLADAAQAFLYPESNNKENSRSKNMINQSTETAEMSDDAYGDEEGTTTAEESSVRSLDMHTPPPKLVDSSALAPSTVKRPIPISIPRSPIPVSSPRSGFDPVFPSSFGEDLPSPIARIRAPPLPVESSSVLSNECKYNEDVIASKHRKWRQQIKLQKKRLQKQDDASILTTCASFEGNKSNKQQEPVHILTQLMRGPCANVDSVVHECDAGALSSDDEEEEDHNNSLIDNDDESSTHYGTSVTGSGGEESESTDERQSDVTGASSETTDASSRSGALSPISKASSGSVSLRSVLKSSSFGSSSVRMSSVSPEEELEQSKTKDVNVIKSFIEDLTEEGTLLIWHGPEGDSSAFRRPCGVVAHLSLGVASDGIYGGPQIVWKKQDGSDGGSIDLFDIQSMETASLEMLADYQFAIPGNTFFVVLSNNNHVVFEAGSAKEAKRFIHGLHWVVARLSFNLVVGNPLVSCELLSVKGETSASPQTPLEEALWSKAMNDVTNQLVDKSMTQVAPQEAEKVDTEAS